MAKPSRGARVEDRNHRISALPDALVCHILSFLPTVDAVRTTVLSIRWNRKWTLVPNLDFYERDWKSCDRFMTFVDRVLFFRGSSEIQKLLLDCRGSRIDFARVDSWICTAIWRNVVELDICVDMDFRQQRTFELPQILFTSKALKVLRLSSSFITNPPSTGCFPSLKVLFVDVQPHHDDTTLEKLFSNCPSLEELTIGGVLGGGKVIDVNISAPQLKMLTTYLSKSSSTLMRDDLFHFCINAPKLEYLELFMYHLSEFSFEINANSHFKVNLDLSNVANDHGTALLKDISNVKHLSLSTPDFEIIDFGDIPAFDNLNHLELALFNSNCWGYLTEFLKRSPNLEYLVIKQLRMQYRPANYKCLYSDFNPPEFVPVCMLSHIKTITIIGFKGKQDEMRVAKYLLKHGEVLDKLTIFTRRKGCARSLPNAEEKALYKDFLMFERGSKTCQVEIFN